MLGALSVSFFLFFSVVIRFYYGEEMTEFEIKCISPLLFIFIFLSGRSRADIFAELPSRIDYPDYYDMITNPVALDIIKVYDLTFSFFFFF